MLARGFCECWGKLCVLVVLCPCDILLLIYYSDMADYSNGVSHLARLGGNRYLSSCLENFILSINIADKWVVSQFTKSFVLRELKTGLGLQREPA